MLDVENKIYYKYAVDIINGNEVACLAIKLACKRFIKWFERKDIYFDYEYVDYLIRWVHKLKHTHAPHTNKPFELLDWLQFCIANIYGWKYVDTKLRVTNNVFIMISRKAGKTAFAAAIALISAIADKEIGAEVELVANTREQAYIAFEACSNFALSIDPYKKLIKHTKNQLKIPGLKSKILVLCSETTSLDGYNASTFILDEFHAAKSWDLYNVMKSSQGMRQNPLAIVITTAGYLLAGYPCYDYRQTCLDILKGNKEDDSTFSAIYELDEGDDWSDENVWKKCQPSLGQTVYVKYLKERVVEAKNQSGQEMEVKTKNFNMFCQSTTTWIKDNFIVSSTNKVNLKDFSGELCYMGVDLSETSDMTATAIMFPPNSSRTTYPDKYVFKVLIYLPLLALENSANKQLYKRWNKDGHLFVIDGNVIDYDVILEDQININNNMDLVKVAYDRWHGEQWANDAEHRGLPVFAYSQALGNFTIPTNEFERLLLQDKVILDDNPIIRWAIANCDLKVDWNGNKKPIKSGGVKDKKIDPIIASLQALGAYIYDGYEID